MLGWFSFSFACFSLLFVESSHLQVGLLVHVGRCSVVLLCVLVVLELELCEFNN
uniref:Uncharacterized protein n=1 Tax=Arundo donax TaxID=35708 RepID=A0A0A8XV01_ARUDO